ncbi:uncharacterized protein EV420DRAFT_1709658 [Desarmillaria tabescens]|uniref:BTB domain-containing protein n=1 Tax=Armillaria tabescens TaxID=1929756 RepID=A0AA39NI10_ARMTA|nr:uncharacterized protein EV420DRAFT_1709658 [Desarmillaria tabescens]KAK0465999.1 hypothetical protein EV420DRAFT_1709658 [Desarmillaria tabescens]
MDTNESSTITLTKSPFNNASEADLVIRTADNVDFFVLKALLSLKSPTSFFRHVLEPHTSERSDLPVLKVKEDSDTFRIMLFFCYPYDTPNIETIEQFTAVGVALKKYCMDNAFKRFVKAAITSRLIEEQPLRVFCFAAANGWRNTLATPLHPEAELEDLKHMNALQHFRLRDYHRKCGKVAQVGFDPMHGAGMTWLQGQASQLLFLQSIPSCRWCLKPVPYLTRSGDGNFRTHTWLRDYLDEVNTQASERRRPEVALDDDIVYRAVVKSIAEYGHADWTKIASKQIHRYAKLLAKEIDRRISEMSNMTALTCLPPNGLSKVSLDVDWTM